MDLFHTVKDKPLLYSVSFKLLNLTNQKTETRGQRARHEGRFTLKRDLLE